MKNFKYKVVDKEKQEVCEEFVVDTDHYQYPLYSGVCDADGREVYDGDVLRDGEDEKLLLFVYYHEGDFWCDKFEEDNIFMTKYWRKPLVYYVDDIKSARLLWNDNTKKEEK